MIKNSLESIVTFPCLPAGSDGKEEIETRKQLQSWPTKGMREKWYCLTFVEFEQNVEEHE